MGHLFALVVFFADGFVALTPRAPAQVVRFLRIAHKLPMDLQMVLCNRLFGSPKDNVPSKYSEPGFKLLARDVAWPV